MRNDFTESPEYTIQSDVSTTEETFCVTGMSCSACAARVERAVGSMPGVHRVQVNLLTGSMRAAFGPELKAEDIICAVESAGYGAALARQAPRVARQNNVLKRRFVSSLILLIPLVLLHHLWHGSAAAVVQLLLTLPILWMNRAFFIKGFSSVLRGGSNMDTLVALGAAAAMADGIVNFLTHHRGELFYFESAAMILTLITFGKWLESRATGRTGQALEKLMSLLPHTATVLRNGQSVRIPADAVQVGDLLQVLAGERFATDGTVEDGYSAVDESTLTGESMPAEKSAGSTVYAGSVNGHGVLTVRATKTRAASALSDMIHLVGEAAAGKAPISRIADRISAVFVPIVVGLSLLTAAGWLLAGAEVAFALSCSIAVLVISCPCALGLATPVAIMVGTGHGAENGILFRNGEALENLQRIRTLILDKTGTLTAGKPQVTAVHPATGYTTADLLQLAISLEAQSHHPLAEAIRTRYPQAAPHEATEHRYLPGKGITASINGTPCAAGNAALMHELHIQLPPADSEAALPPGQSILYFACGGEYRGYLAVADPLKPDSPAAVAALQKLGLHLVMLTGDSKATAQAIATQAGLTHWQAGMLPQDKEQYIRHLQAAGSAVAMVGDGINDAPALTRADVGIAIGAGTDIALESAGVILVRSSLMDAVGAIRLSRAVIRNIRQNFFWALFYNCLAIPLAAGVFYPLLGWQLHPAMAAAAMGLSSFCVVCNALRLRRFTLLPPQRMKTITIKVDGMMCPHCEAHVTKALCALPGVVECRASHQAKEVVITLSTEIPLAQLHGVITAQGYKVL